jgi:hypothetical protein
MREKEKRKRRASLATAQVKAATLAAVACRLHRRPQCPTLGL